VTLVLTLLYTCKLSPYAPRALFAILYGSLRFSSLLWYTEYKVGVALINNTN
jgi:hypothetical protein